MNKLIVFFALTLSYSLFASASNIKSELNNNLGELNEQFKFHQVGQATLSFLFWDLYKSRLLTTSGKYPINENNDKLIYEINYLRDISKDDLVDRTVEQWQHLELPSQSYQKFIPQLQQIWPDIIEGDTLSLFIDNKTSFFYFNKVHIGRIDDPTFGQIFLDIWLAEKTSQPKLRSQLLGQTNHE